MLRADQNKNNSNNTLAKPKHKKSLQALRRRETTKNMRVLTHICWTPRHMGARDAVLWTSSDARRAICDHERTLLDIKELKFVAALTICWAMAVSASHTDQTTRCHKSDRATPSHVPTIAIFCATPSRAMYSSLCQARHAYVRSCTHLSHTGQQNRLSTFIPGHVHS